MFIPDCKDAEEKFKLRASANLKYTAAIDKIFNEVFDYVVNSVLEANYHYADKKEFKTVGAEIIKDAFRAKKNYKTFFPKYVSPSTNHHFSSKTVFGYNTQILSMEDAYAGFEGSYWMDEDVSDIYADECIPYYFDKDGFFIRYDADLDAAKIAFEKYYFDPVKEELKKIKQLDLFKD